MKYSQQNIGIEAELTFSNLDGLMPLGLFMKNGGEVIQGMEVMCERSRRAPLIKGTVISWVMKEVVFDLTKLGKYGECIAQVQDETGCVLGWPFTMLYVKTPAAYGNS